MESYEQKYKKALERARKYKRYNYMMINAALDKIFPELKELKESEYERIRNDIRDLIEVGLEDGSAIAPGSKTTKEEAIAWLEKQESIDKEKVLTDARRDVALSIMNYIGLSGMERADLESGVVYSDWSKVYDYMKEKFEKQKKGGEE